MRRLVLTLGNRSCTLMPDDLQKHPDSLLTKFASTVGDNICQQEALHVTQLGSAVDITDDSITMKLDKLPNSADDEAADSWESFALEILLALYRDNCVPVETLERLLEAATRPTTVGASIYCTAAHLWLSLYNSITVAVGSSSSNNNVAAQLACQWRLTDNGFPEFYKRLASLLEFLDLSGPVSRWLPLTDIEVTCQRALAFSYACIAYDAADLLLSYKPHAAAEGGFEYYNMATFLVTKCADKAALRVRLVKAAQPAQIANAVAYARSRTDASRSIASRLFGASSEPFMPQVVSGTNIVVCSSSKAYITMGQAPAQELPIEKYQANKLEKTAASSDGTIRSMTCNALACTAIGPPGNHTLPIHPKLGQQLAEALCAKCQKRASIAVCYVELCCSDGTFGGRLVLLWVLQWDE